MVITAVMKNLMRCFVLPLGVTEVFLCLIIQSAVFAGWLQPTESPEETQ